MANPTVAEVSSARSVIEGGLAAAPVGTTLPTDATSTLDAAFTGYGYIGTEGIQPAKERATEDYKDMNGDTIYTLQTSFDASFTVPLAQAVGVDVKKLCFGDLNVTEAGGVVTAVETGEPLPHKSFVISTFSPVSGGVAHHRKVIEDGQIVTVEEGPLVSSAVRLYTVTIKVYKTGSTYITEYDEVVADGSGEGEE